MKTNLLLFLNFIILSGCNKETKTMVDLSKPSVTLTVLNISKPLIDENTPGMEAVKYGNEGGEVVKDSKGVYHWFTSEQFGDPYWVANRITHWTSNDGTNWLKDVSWMKEGNHDTTDKKPKSNYFDPTVVYDNQSGYWYMFYVSYWNSPKFAHNRAQIYRCRAVNPGIDGLGGPYHDNDQNDMVVLEPLDKPEPYEAKWVGDSRSGLGCASVSTPYKVGDWWYIVYAENMLACAKSLTDKFERIPEGADNPITYNREPMDWDPNYLIGRVYSKFYIENPVIYKISEGSTGAGTYISLVGYYTDSSIGVTQQRYGYSTSADGIHWSAFLPVPAQFGDCITACSFIPEGNDEYSIYVTGRENNYERFARIKVKLEVK
jgi:hypothetical protein